MIENTPNLRSNSETHQPIEAHKIMSKNEPELCLSGLVFIYLSSYKFAALVANHLHQVEPVVFARQRKRPKRILLRAMQGSMERL